MPKSWDSRGKNAPNWLKVKVNTYYFYFSASINRTQFWQIEPFCWFLFDLALFKDRYHKVDVKLQTNVCNRGGRLLDYVPITSPHSPITSPRGRISGKFSPAPYPSDWQDGHYVHWWRYSTRTLFGCIALLVTTIDCFFCQFYWHSEYSDIFLFFLYFFPTLVHSFSYEILTFKL
jgi:hypothetical protein